MGDREHVLGPTYSRRRTPRFEFKPSSTNYTGGGYARIRTSERRETTAGDGADDVFVSIHRLCAVAWYDSLADAPEDVTAADILRSGELAGMDVHHTLGMPSANGEDLLEIIDHGGHSEVTQAQKRAWGEDAKQQVFEFSEDDVLDWTCDNCGERDPEVHCRVSDMDVCLDCSTVLADGSPIEIIE